MNKHHLLLLASICVALTACDRETKPQPEPTTAASPRVELQLTDELRARLAAADAVDGKTDHVIEKCVSCKLQMGGTPEFTSTVADYRVQLCSAGCKKAFEGDPGKLLLALPAAKP
ncbi:MAG: hypothetical protein WCQ21_23330 [Verrucomicrobiota bacterium]|jgi:hypothetical protein